MLSHAWSDLREGAIRKFCFVEIDLAGHSAISASNSTRDAEATFSAFLDYIEEKVNVHGGQAWSLAGDGGLFAFYDDDVTTMAEQATAAALDIVDGLPEFNRTMSRVKQQVRARIAVHLGDARYFKQTGRIQSDDINFVAHLEKGVTKPDSVSVSGNVYRELTQKELRSRFRDNGTFESRSVYSSAAPNELESRAATAPPQPVCIGAPKLRTLRLGLTVLAVAAAFAVSWWGVNEFSGGAPAIQSLAVLPLDNLTGDPDQDYLVDGIHESLTSELSKISALKVISRTSAMQYKEVRESAPQISRALGVDGLIEGSVAREGDQVRIVVQLIHGPSDRHLWTQSFDRELRGILALYSDVAQAICREIRIALTPKEKIRLASARPVNPEAYEAYLRGMFYANKLTLEGFERSFAYLRQAIENDPAHPLPYANLALVLNQFGHGVAPPPGVFPQAKAAALKALELDEQLAEAHAALAEIRLVYEWDWPGAEQAFRRALELNPNIAAAHLWYGWYLFMMGRRDEAFTEMKRTKELDPLTPLWTAWLGWFYWVAGKDEEGINEVQKSLELNPDLPFAFYVLGCIYAEKGMYQEAIAAHQKAADVSRFWSWGLGISYALAGRKDEARKIAADLEKGTPLPLYKDRSVKNPWGLAEIFTALGEKDKAFQWLEAGLEQRQSWMPWIGQNPNFKPLQDDPRFQALLRRMNLP